MAGLSLGAGSHVAFVYPMTDVGAVGLENGAVVGFADCGGTNAVGENHRGTSLAPGVNKAIARCSGHSWLEGVFHFG